MLWSLGSEWRFSYMNCGMTIFDLCNDLRTSLKDGPNLERLRKGGAEEQQELQRWLSGWRRVAQIENASLWLMDEHEMAREFHQGSEASNPAFYGMAQNLWAGTAENQPWHDVSDLQTISWCIQKYAIFYKLNAEHEAE
ncbi:hypothetical protein BT63DRAFT_162491 [Microthyrium microscopicum]|uniref:Uncharacterized protein n=1 Tax=Microthyrium microscopicum TaxID=703497 RepID=A0A6A6UQC5_9PEZI|nr:hypothetical protein BT63DRAFT_162491 [Microthyrium microscopicum]